VGRRGVGEEGEAWGVRHEVELQEARRDTTVLERLKGRAQRPARTPGNRPSEPPPQTAEPGTHGRPPRARTTEKTRHRWAREGDGAEAGRTPFEEHLRINPEGIRHRGRASPGAVYPLSPEGMPQGGENETSSVEKDCLAARGQNAHAVPGRPRASGKQD